MVRGYEGLQPYFGDLHNHCAVGYGHGTLEDAFRNARMQLDFACVTVHAHWPDIPVTDARLEPVVDYHQRGFERTAAAWPRVQQVVEANNVPGTFASFLGFEWHSCEYGDHNVYFKGSEGDIIRARDLEDMRRQLRAYGERGVDSLLLPHHIGYKTGYRGINWSAFTPEFSPIVEIMSMHGAAEGPDAPYPYLHTMGPRDWQSTWQYGLAQGHLAGVMGSTDHHSGHPGSYGHGRLAVWADSLTRDAIWEGIRQRRTVALTGDNIRVLLTVNGGLIGSILPYQPTRTVEVVVEGGAAIDYVELVYNNQVIHRTNDYATDGPTREPFKVHFEVGWAEKHELVDWTVELGVEGGRLLDVEPRFRGAETVAPQANEEASYAFSAWQQPNGNDVRFQTRTWGNLTTTTASTQGVCLTIDGGLDTQLHANVNGVRRTVRLSELIQGPHSGYLGGFLTPAYVFHRAAPSSEFTTTFTLEHESAGATRDWYYVRVRQKNGQCAWSSPVWVEAGENTGDLRSTPS